MKTKVSVEEVKKLIVGCLNLSVAVGEIQDNVPLTDPPLQLDSVDFLELIFCVEQKYKISITDDMAETAFESVLILQSFIVKEMGHG